MAGNVLSKVRSNKGASTSKKALLALACASLAAALVLSVSAPGSGERTQGGDLEAASGLPSPFVGVMRRAAGDAEGGGLLDALVHSATEAMEVTGVADGANDGLLAGDAVSNSALAETTAAGEEQSVAEQGEAAAVEQEPAGETNAANAASAADAQDQATLAHKEAQLAAEEAEDVAESAASQANVDAQSTDAPAPEATSAPAPLEGALEQTLALADGNTLTVRAAIPAEAAVPTTATLQMDGVSGDVTAAITSVLDVDKDDWLRWGTIVDLRLIDANGAEIVPAAPLTLEFQTTAVAAEESDGLEVALLPGTRLAATNATQSDADHARVQVVAPTLGQFAVGEVEEPKFSWSIRGTEVKVLGPRASKVAPRTSGSPDEMGEVVEGLRVVDLFSTEVDPTRAFPTRLWIESTPADEPVESGVESGLLGCVVERGRMPRVLFGLDGTADPAPFEAGENLALLWDSGYREESLDLGSVSLEGLLPKGANVQVNDVTATTDAQQVAERVADADVDRYDYATVVAYDLGFDVEGATYAPDADHALAVSVDAATSADASDLEVWHVAPDGAATAVGAVANNGSVAFAAEDAGSYVVVEKTVLEREVTASDGRTYDITLTYTGDAGLPRGTDMRVTELSDDARAAYEPAALDALGGRRVAYLRAFDIALVAPDGTEVEPAGEVSVSIRLADEDATEEASVLHFSADPATPEVLPAQATAGPDGAVTYDFSASSFSVYAVAYTVDTQFRDCAGNTWKVTAEFGPETGLPADVELKVRELSDDESAGYLASTAEALGKDEAAVRIARAFDITFEKNGKEYHALNDDVTISIQLLDQDVTDTMQVVHMAAEPERLAAQISENTLTFASDSFSVYVVVEGEPTVQYRFVDPTGHEYASLQQTLKEGQKLAEPLAPTDEGRVFKHWVQVNDPSDPAEGPAFDAWDTPVSIEVPNPGQRYPIIRYLKAVFVSDAPQVSVTWHDQGGRIIRTDLVDNGAEVDPDVVVYTAQQVKVGEYLVFQYWTQDPYDVNENGEPARFNADGDPVRVTDDVDLYPYCAQFHWIYFNGNKSEGDEDTTKPRSVPYTAPLLVVPGVTPDAASTPKNPQGYRFLGWFTKPDASGEMVFDASGVPVAEQFTAQKLYRGGDSLGYDPTLYAHWEAETRATFSVAVYRQRAGDAYAQDDDGNEVDANYHFDFDQIVVNPGTFMALAADTSKLHLNGQNVEYTEDGTTTKVAYTIDLNNLLSGADLNGFELDAGRCSDVTVRADGTSVFRIYLRRKKYTLIFKDYQLQGGRTMKVSGITDAELNATYSNNKTFRTMKTITALYGQDISNEFPISEEKSNGFYLNTSNRFATGASTNVMTNNSWMDADGSSLGSTLYKRIDYVPAFNGGRTTEYFVHNAVAFQPNKEAHNLVYYVEDLNSAASGTDSYTKLGDTTFTLNGIRYKRFGNKINYGGGGISAKNFDGYNIDGFSQKTALYRAHSYNGRNVAPKTITSWNSVGNNDDVFCFYARNNYKVQLKYVRDGAAAAGSDTLTLPYETSITKELLASHYNFSSTNPLRKEAGEDVWWFNDAACNDPFNFSDAKVPNYHITIYKGMKTSAPVEIDADGGELDGTTQSTWFNLDSGELISEYTVVRDFQTVEDAGVDPSTLDTAYKYVRYPYGTVIGGKKVRSASYVELTSAELAEVKASATGTFDASADPYCDGTAYVYSPGVYSFQYWYKVTADFDESTSTFVPNEKPSDSKRAYNFTNPTTGPVYLKAKWADASSYSIVYVAGDPDEHIEAPLDNQTYSDGSQAVVKPSLDHPDGKVFRFWATTRQGDEDDPASYAGTKFYPNQTLTLSRSLTRDSGAERLVTLYAWYAEGAFTGEAATYDFYVPDENGVWHDGEDDTPYYVEIISPNEYLIVPDTPEDKTGQGRVFVGWFLDKAATKRFEGFGMQAHPTNHRLYAGFSSIYTVKYYDRPYGEANAHVITEQVYKVNDRLNTGGVAPILSEDQYVDHWEAYTGEAGSYTPWSGGEKGNYVAFDAKGGTFGKDLNADLTLFPVIGTVYTLSFDSQGGTRVASVTFPRNVDQWVSAPEAPTRTGYDFEGWWTAPKGDTNDISSAEGGVQYLFDQSLGNWKAANGLSSIPRTLYAHWKRNSDPIYTTFNVNYYVQLADRSGYILYNTETFDTDKTGAKYQADQMHALDVDELALSHMAGYYTFSDDQKTGQGDDQSLGYFELSTPENYTNYGEKSKASETQEKEILEDGSTQYNVYFNRKVFTLIFEPDRQYTDEEVIGRPREVVGLGGWADVQSLNQRAIGTNGADVQYISVSAGSVGLINYYNYYEVDRTKVLYNINNSFRDTIPTGGKLNSNSDYQAKVYLGMDTGAIWPTPSDLNDVAKERGGNLSIDYQSKNVGNNEYRQNDAHLLDGNGFNDRTTNYKYDTYTNYNSATNYVNGVKYTGPGSTSASAVGLTSKYGYKWIDPWTGDKTATVTNIEWRWANGYTFNGWSVYKGELDGLSEMTYNYGTAANKRTITTDPTFGSRKNSSYNKGLAAPAYIDRSILFDSNNNTTYTMLADYAKSNLYTTTPSTTANPVTVRYYTIGKDTAGNETYTNVPEYTQTMYGIAGTGNWAPTAANWTTVEGKRSSIPGYKFVEGRYENTSAYTAYGTEPATQIVQLYDYYLPVNYYYHRAMNVGNAFAGLQLSGASVVTVNGRQYYKLTNVREGSYSLVYTYLGLAGHWHDYTDPVYTFAAGKTHNVRNAKGTTTAAVKAALETLYQNAGDLPASGGRVKNGQTTITNSSGAHFMNLYFTPDTFEVTLKSTNASDANYGGDHSQTLEVYYNEFLTNRAGTGGAIAKAIGDSALPALAVPDDYEFCGWSISPNSNTTFEGTMPSYKVTLWAQFKARDNTITTEGVDKNGKLWRDDQGNIRRHEDGAKNPLSWTEYDGYADGDALEDDYERTLPYGTALLEYGLPTPKLQGFEAFYGWKRLNDNGTLSPGYVGDATVVRTDMVLVPDIRVNQSGVVNYYQNQATSSSGSSADEPLFVAGPFYANATSKAAWGTQTGERGAAALGIGERNFVCWNTKSDGTGTNYYPGENIPMPAEGETLDLYATYSSAREVKLVYHLNGGTEFLYATSDTTMPTTTFGDENVIAVDFDNYDEAQNKVRFPNVHWPASADGSKNAFVPVKPGETFLKWNTEADGSGMDVLTTDTLRVDKLPTGKDNVFHLYAQWVEMVLPVSVYEAWYGDTTNADPRNVLDGKNPYLKENTTKEQTGQKTGDEWYNVYERNGLTTGASNTTKFIFMAAYATSDDTTDVANRITNIRFNADSMVNAWQYSKDNGSHWTNFGSAGVAFYYFPEEIIPRIHYVIKDASGALSEVDPSVYNITIRKPEAITTSPNNSDPKAWVATSTSSVKEAAGRGVVIDPGFHTIGVESDAYLLTELKTGPYEATTVYGKLTTELSNPAYAQNTKNGMVYGKSVKDNELQGSKTVVGEHAIYAVYEAGKPICKIVDEGIEHPFERINDALAYARAHMGGNTTIEMLVDYAMPEDDKATVKAGENIKLTTAATEGGKFNFTCAEEGRDKAILSRGTVEGTLLTNNGTLEVDRIVLDGGSKDGKESKAHGGLIATDAKGATLTVGADAVLQNSKVVDKLSETDAGVGGAVWLRAGSTLAMSGTIDNCHAVQGGGIYAESESKAQTQVSIAGTIQNCSVAKGGAPEKNSDNKDTIVGGGAVSVSRNVVVNVLDGAVLANNTATSDNGKGGAIYADGTVVISGGELYKNESLQGGAVYIASKAKLEMSGGVIRDNKSSKGAVAIGGSDSNPATLAFSGSAQVYNNTKDDGKTLMNVYLSYGDTRDTNSVIKVQGDLTDEATIGVYVKNGDPGAVFDAHGGANDPFGTCEGGSFQNLSAFVNDLNGLKGGAGANNTVVWRMALKVKAIYAPSVDLAYPFATDELLIKDATTLLEDYEFVPTGDTVSLDDVVADVADSLGPGATSTMQLWRAWRAEDEEFVMGGGDPGEGAYEQGGYDLMIGDFAVTGIQTFGYSDSANPGMMYLTRTANDKPVVREGDVLVLCYTEPVYLTLDNRTAFDGADGNKWLDDTIGRTVTVTGTDESGNEVEETKSASAKLKEVAEVLNADTGEYAPVANDLASLTPAANGRITLRILGAGGMDYHLHGGFAGATEGIQVHENDKYKQAMRKARTGDFTLDGTLVKPEGALPATTLLFSTVTRVSVPLIVQKEWDVPAGKTYDEASFTIYGKVDGQTDEDALVATDAPGGTPVSTITGSDKAKVGGVDKTWAKVVYVPARNADDEPYVSYRIGESDAEVAAIDPALVWEATTDYQPGEWEPVTNEAAYVDGYIKLRKTAKFVGSSLYTNNYRIEFYYTDDTEENFYCSAIDFADDEKITWEEKDYYLAVKLPASLNLDTPVLLHTGYKESDGRPETYRDPTGRVSKSVTGFNGLYGIYTYAGATRTTQPNVAPSFKQHDEDTRQAFDKIEFVKVLPAGVTANTGDQQLYTFPHAQANTRLVLTNHAYICKITDAAGVEHGFTSLNNALTYARAHKAASGDDASAYVDGTATIQMLVDYVVPEDDTLTLGDGDNITLTTAAKKDALPSGETYYYTGSGDVATITRGFDGAELVKVNHANASVTLDNITLDGHKDAVEASEGVAAEPVRTGRAVTVNKGTLNVADGAKIQHFKAETGAAVQVGAGATLAMAGGSITANEATGADGGAVNVADATSKLNFSGAPLVFGNAGAAGAEKDVVLSVADNGVINTVGGGLTGGEVGVFVTGAEGTEPYLGHGTEGKPFGTFAAGADENLSVFKNNRRPGVFGAKGTTGSQIVWSSDSFTVTKVWKDADGNEMATDDVKDWAIYYELFQVQGGFASVSGGTGKSIPSEVVITPEMPFPSVSQIAEMDQNDRIKFGVTDGFFKYGDKYYYVYRAIDQNAGNMRDGLEDDNNLRNNAVRYTGKIWTRAMSTERENDKTPILSGVARGDLLFDDGNYYVYVDTDGEYVWRDYNNKVSLDRWRLIGPARGSITIDYTTQDAAEGLSQSLTTGQGAIVSAYTNPNPISEEGVPATYFKMTSTDSWQQVFGNLPVGYSYYAVERKVVDGDGRDVTLSYAKSYVYDKNDNKSVKITNQYSDVEITLRNLLVDNMTNGSVTFDYSATLVDAKGNPIAGAKVADYVHVDETTGTKTTVPLYTNDEGQVSFTHPTSGEKLTSVSMGSGKELVMSLPKGSVLTVTQQPNARYTTSVSAEKATNGHEGADANRVFKLTVAEEDTITYTNTLIGQRLRVRLVGDDAADGLAGGKFAIRCPSDDSAEDINVTGLVSSGEAADLGLVKSTHIADGVLYVLPFGKDYTVAETAAPKYYDAVGDVVLGSADGSLTLRSVGGASELAGATLTSETDGQGVVTYTLTLTNKRQMATVTVVKNAAGGRENTQRTYNYRQTGLPGAAETFELRGSDDSATTDEVENQRVFVQVPCGTVITLAETDYVEDTGELRNMVLFETEDSTSSMTGVATGNYTVEKDVEIAFTQVNTGKGVSVPLKKTLSLNKAVSALSDDEVAQLKALSFTFVIEGAETNPEGGASVAHQYVLKVADEWDAAAKSGDTVTFAIDKAWSIGFSAPGMYKFTVSEVDPGENALFSVDTANEPTTLTYYVVQEAIKKNGDEVEKSVFRIAEKDELDRSKVEPQELSQFGQSDIELSKLFNSDYYLKGNGAVNVTPIMSGGKQTGIKMFLSQEQDYRTIGAITTEFAFDFSRSFEIDGTMQMVKEDGMSFAFQTNQDVPHMLQEGAYGVDKGHFYTDNNPARAVKFLEGGSSTSAHGADNGNIVTESGMGDGFLFTLFNEPVSGIGSFRMSGLNRIPYAATDWNGQGSKHYEILTYVNKAGNVVNSDRNIDTRQDKAKDKNCGTLYYDYTHEQKYTVTFACTDHANGIGTLTIHMLGKTFVYQGFNAKQMFGASNWRSVYFVLAAAQDNKSSTSMAITDFKYLDGFETGTADASFWADRDHDGEFETLLNTTNSPALVNETVLVRHKLTPLADYDYDIAIKALVTQLRNVTANTNLIGSDVRLRSGDRVVELPGVSGAFNTYDLDKAMPALLLAGGEPTYFEYTIMAPAKHDQTVIESALFGEPPFPTAKTKTIGFRTEGDIPVVTAGFANSTQFFTVTYDYGEEDEERDDVVVSCLQNSTHAVMAEPELDGYVFQGWAREGVADPYVGGETISVGGNIKLVAQWDVAGHAQVILRKVDGTSRGALPGAVFDVYGTRGSSPFVVKDTGEELKDKPSTSGTSANGVIWVGTLPQGAYVLHEKKAPEEYAADGKLTVAKPYFVMLVKDTGAEVAADGYDTLAAAQKASKDAWDAYRNQVKAAEAAQGE